jgi:acetyl esterase/lipase
MAHRKSNSIQSTLQTFLAISITPLYKTLLLVALVAFLALALILLFPLKAINTVTTGHSVTIEKDIAYGAHARHKLDVYKPTLIKPPNGYPMVVFFYGGSWNRGDRADYKFIGDALASRGIVTVVADYRLYPDVRYPEFLNDCAAALAYALKQLPALNADPKRVFVMGHSAGAYNAAMMAFDKHWLSAVGISSSSIAGFIGIAGPYDFLPMTNPDTQPVFFHPNYPKGSQPFEYVTGSSPRSFIGAAKVDNLVNPGKNSVRMASQLTQSGVPVTLKLYERVNHMTIAAAFAWPLRWLAPVLNDVVEFIDAR